MGYNCEAGSFSKKTYNISGADCVSYSKTGCLLLQTIEFKSIDLTVPLVSSKRSSGCRGQHLLLVFLIIMKDSSNLRGGKARILSQKQLHSNTEMGFYLFVCLFCYHRFTSSLGSYQLIYISTSPGQIQAQAPSQVAGMTMQTHVKSDFSPGSSVIPQRTLAMSRDIFACHNLGKKGRLTVACNKQSVMHRIAPHSKELSIPKCQQCQR